MARGSQGRQPTKTHLADSQPDNSSAPGNFDAWQIIKAAIEAVPAVKFALGIAGIMAAFWLGRAFFGSAKMAIFVAVVMLILMLLLLVFAAATKLGPKFLQPPALVFTWTIVASFAIS